MSEDTTSVVDPQNSGGEQENQSQQSKMFDEAYVKELRQEAAGYRIKLREFEQAQKEAEDKRLAEQNEWQKLAETRLNELQELQPYKEQYESMLSSISESNSRRIESIPEQMRNLVPDFGDPVKLANWLDVNAQLLSKPLAAELNGNAGGGERPTEQATLNEDQLKVARNLNVSAKEYQQAMRT